MYLRRRARRAYIEAAFCNVADHGIKSLDIVSCIRGYGEGVCDSWDYAPL